MNHEKLPAQGAVDVLIGRLRAHAEAHEYIANADAEQKQWMNDLYDAADEIERLRDALRKVAQALAWQCFGECRSFGGDVTLLHPRDADALAKAILTPNAELSGRELIDGVADRLEVLEREHSDFFERWHGERRKREDLTGAVDRCYRMLLSEPDTKGALFKAENILREALADAKLTQNVGAKLETTAAPK